MSGHHPWAEIQRKRLLTAPAWKLAVFQSTLKVEQIDARNWKLLETFIYDSDVVAQRIIIPAGFVTDFASVPRVPIAYLLFGGRANSAATVHDWLYTTGMFPKRQCDAVFYEAMRASGVRLDIAWWMWLGVAWGGGRAWREHRADINPDLFGQRLRSET